MTPQEAGVLSYLGFLPFACSGLHSYTLMMELRSFTNFSLDKLLPLIYCDITAPALLKIVQIVTVYERTIEDPKRSVLFRYCTLWGPQYFSSLRSKNSSHLLYTVACAWKALNQSKENADPENIAAVLNLSTLMKSTLKKAGTIIGETLKSMMLGGDPECKKNYHQGSSSSASSQIMTNCAICMKSKPSIKFFAINDCKHSYCSRCLGSYIAAKVKMNVTLIKCPDPKCTDGKLEPLACKLIIKKKVFDRWCDSLSESAIGVKFYCPFKDCSALLIDERGQEVIRESECPHCHRLFCASCRVPWHSGLSCRKFLEMDKLGREKKHDKMVMELAKESKWQRCPKCKFYVEKSSGCMFIKCRCGCIFCYGCASEMEVDHYCRKCKR